MANTTVTYGVDSNLRKNSYTKTGYSFTGWNAYRESDKKWRYKNNTTGDSGWYVKGTQPSGYRLIKYGDEAELSKTSSVNNDIVTMYAVWEVNTYTVKYNANGGSGSTMANTTVTYGVDSNLRKNSYTKTGYSFTGWNAYRESDKKWRYKNNTTGDSGWYVKGTQPSGYRLIKYGDEAELSKTSSVDNDIVTMYAVWEVNTNPTKNEFTIDIKKEIRYNQKDYKQFVDNACINVGCLPTAIATCIAFVKQSTFLPTDVSFEPYVVGVTKYPAACNDNKGLSKMQCYSLISQSLTSNKPCVMKVYCKSGYSHYVSVIGYVANADPNNLSYNDLIILDPYDGKVKYLKDVSNYKECSNNECQVILII